MDMGDETVDFVYDDQLEQGGRPRAACVSSSIL